MKIGYQKPIRFNKDDVLEILRRKKIKAYHYKKFIICEFNRVKLGSETEGFIIYDKVIVILKGFKIDGFMFRFAEFDYSSYWNLNPMHPHLKRINRVEVYNLNEYALTIKKMVRKYNPEEAIISVTDIISQFQRVRKLWATAQFFIKDRTKLSKSLFAELIINK